MKEKNSIRTRLRRLGFYLLKRESNYLDCQRQWLLVCFAVMLSLGILSNILGVSGVRASRPVLRIKEMKVFNKLFADIQESYSELVYKVSWPTRTQLVNSAMIVLVASIILSLIIWGVDEVINFIMETIYGLHK